MSPNPTAIAPGDTPSPTHGDGAAIKAARLEPLKTAGADTMRALEADRAAPAAGPAPLDGEPVRFPTPPRAEAAVRRALPPHAKRRILFAYERAADNPLIDGGLPYWTLKLLGQQERVSERHPVCARPGLGLGARAAYHAMRSERLWLDVEPRILSKRYEDLSAAVRGSSYHGVFAPSPLAVTHLGDKTPVVFCARAPFGAYADGAPEYAGLTARSRAHGFAQEQTALSRCAAAIYPSAWAVDIAVARHGAARDKLHILPFGANIPEPAEREVAEALEARSEKPRPVRLAMFVEDWEDGRAPFAIDICRAGWGDGGVRLDIITAKPTRAARTTPDFVTVHTLAKSGKTRTRDVVARKVLRAADLVIAPALGAQAAYDLNVAAAAAWGVPVIGAQAGAMDVLVGDGLSGRLLKPDAGVRDYIEAIEDLTDDANRMRAMGVEARMHYTGRLSWDHFSAGLIRIFDGAVTDTSLLV